MTWKKEFSWDRGKAVLICQDYDARLIWEETDPWRLWIGEKEITDLPYIHAEDWELSIKYAECEISKII